MFLMPKAFSEIVKSDPSLAEKYLSLVESLINNYYSRFWKWQLKDSECAILVEIIRSDPSLAREGFDLIKFQGDKLNCEVRKSVCLMLVDLVKIDLSLAKEGFNLIKNQFAYDQNIYVRDSAKEGLVSIMSELISTSVQNEWILTKIIDDLDIVEDKKDTGQVISFIATNLKNLPEFILKKLVNILSDKYKNMQDLIKDKFSFLKDSVEIQVDSFIAPQQNQMIEVRQEQQNLGDQEELMNEHIVEDPNYNQIDQENQVQLSVGEEFLSDEIL